MYTAHPEPGWIDSGELAVVSHTLGIPHPTGSPLYVVASRLFTAIVPGTFLPLTLLSALSVAGAIVLFVSLPLGGKRAPVLVLGAAALVFALAPSVWKQAVINEVYAFQILLFVVFLWLWLRPGLRHRPWILAYLAGLSFANHQSAIFLTPFLIDVIWPHRRLPSAWLRMIGLGLLGMSLYLYLPIRSARLPLLDWGGTSHLDAFWRHITGWQYSGWVGTDSLDSLIQSLSFLGARIWDNLPWIVTPLALVGLSVLWRRRRGAAMTMVASVLLCVLFGLNFPNPDIEAFYLLAFIVLIVWAAEGTLWLAARGRVWMASVLVAVLVSLGAHWSGNYAAINARDFRVPTDWVMDALETVEPGSVILTREWDHYAPWLYLRFVKGVRPDVLWIDTELLRRSWYPEFIRQADPERFDRARAALDQLAPQISIFESGLRYDPAAIETAYANAIFALSLGQSGPVYTDGSGTRPSDWGVERRYLHGAREVPWGLLIRLFRPGESVPRLPPWPAYRNRTAHDRGSPRTRVHLDLYRAMRGARGAYAP